MTKNRIALLMIVASAGMACPALAQDSTSRNSDAGNGLPGDALSPWTVGAPFQKSSYVVDMAQFFTTGGTRFGIAPIIKASKSNTANFSSLLSANGISQTLRSNAAYPAANYRAWAVATAGVNPTENNTTLASNVNVSGTSTRFGAVMAEFATSTGGFNVNNVLGAVVNYDASTPDRLFVQRTVASVNMPNGTTGDSSQVGLGSIDTDGNVHIRMDGLSTVGPLPLTGANYFRTNLISRNVGSINFFDNTGGSDAGAANVRLLTNSATAHNTPSGIPANLAGRPVLLGSNFLTTFLHEKVAGSLFTETAATFLAAPATDIRGGVSFSKQVLFGGVGTSGLLGKTGADTDALSLWGVAANGDVTGRTTLVRPAAGVVDPCEAFTFQGVFDGYRSQVAARGGNGIVAIGRDRQGRGLAAGVMYNTASAQNPWNGIAVVRFDPSNPAGTAEWTLAAWNDPANLTGKPLRGDYGADGFAFTGDAGEFDGVIDATDAPIGRLASAFEVSGSLIGPSMSAPAFDSAGNVYFMASFVQNKRAANGSTFQDFDIGLVRGIYDEVNFCYTLEVVLEPGDTFVGKNSNVRYQVQFLDLLDSNSVSSGTVFSGSVNQASWNNGARPRGIFNREAQNLGGLVVGAKIVYDVNGDGLYEDPTSTGGNAASVDEAYNTLLYIGNANPPRCPVDFDGDGFPTGDDFDAYVAAFELGDISADYDGDGFVTGDDFDAFVADFEAGC